MYMCVCVYIYTYISMSRLVATQVMLSSQNRVAHSRTTVGWSSHASVKSCLSEVLPTSHYWVTQKHGLN